MRRLPTLFLLAALLPLFAWPDPALAQASRPNASLAQAERSAVDLKQGMTPDEVQQLLGKPRRTALRGTALQWTYVWNGSGASSSTSERSLSVEFAAKAADLWYVNGWGWANY
jgi:outer membrane protein assembly factor BamE (lipoprotein component of BamABCDE complex)